jgi:hypothetical protein
MTRAELILLQLGGKKFLESTNVHALKNTDEGLTMKLRNNKSGANFLKITRSFIDTYTVEFQKVNYIKFTFNDIATFENVYSTELKKVFSEITGLNTK